ncbi:MAG: SH3 domain-containing protein [Clostridia bacterium]|nr:SH3 domain-containing protein [Clostridia bacterium]
MKKRLLVLIVLLVLCWLVPMNSLAVRYGQVVRVVSGSSTKVRSGPGTNHSSIGNAYLENIYPYLGTENGWYHIRYVGNLDGYVDASKCAVEPGLVQDSIGDGPFVDAVVRITNRYSINIRSGPAKAYDVVGTAYPDETYPYLGPEDGWYCIRMNNGLEGYVAANRTSVEILSEIPATQAPTAVPTAIPTAVPTAVPTMAPVYPPVDDGICDMCGGNGLCRTCDGMGLVYGAVEQRYIVCPSCLGFGYCWICRH